MYEMVIPFPHMNCTQIAEKVWEIKKKSLILSIAISHIFSCFRKVNTRRTPKQNAAKSTFCHQKLSVLFWMGDGASRHRSARNRDLPRRVTIHHNKSCRFDYWFNFFTLKLRSLHIRWFVRHQRFLLFSQRSTNWSRSWLFALFASFVPGLCSSSPPLLSILVFINIHRRGITW